MKDGEFGQIFQRGNLNSIFLSKIILVLSTKLQLQVAGSPVDLWTLKQTSDSSWDPTANYEPCPETSDFTHGVSMNSSFASCPLTLCAYWGFPNGCFVKITFQREMYSKVFIQTKYCSLLSWCNDKDSLPVSTLTQWCSSPVKTHLGLKLSLTKNDLRDNVPQKMKPLAGVLKMRLEPNSSNWLCSLGRSPRLTYDPGIILQAFSSYPTMRSQEAPNPSSHHCDFQDLMLRKRM